MGYLDEIGNHKGGTKMNKYQVVLDWVSAGNDSCGTEWDLLQELVDKETPMKKTIKKGRPYCAKCSYSLLIEDVWEMSYCCACGQKIDWSDEE